MDDNQPYIWDAPFNRRDKLSPVKLPTEVPAQIIESGQKPIGLWKAGCVRF
jgi:hypothetical protein